MNLHRIVLMGLLTTALSLPNISQSQSPGYIYGRILLKNGQTFAGQIRWDNQEATWNDIFDAYKADRPYQNLLSASEAKKLKAEGGGFKLDFMELWEDRNPDFSFMFRCSFGDMVKLEAQSSDVLTLTLKNGHKMNLRKDGGDADDDIVVVDKNLGRQKIDFSKIKSINFESTPSNFKSPMGEPIFGKILTSGGSFEGYITWDDEECLGEDIISGRQNGQLLDLLFMNIREIKADRDGSLITLKNGQQLFLNDHDDVDRGNHGITVRGLSFGNLTIDWENFISASFYEPTMPMPTYESFPSPSFLTATVRTSSGAKITSQIVFDLDEIYDIEFLNGENGGFGYFIPFSKVDRIEPQNDKFSSITLKDGQELLLGESGDVDMQNNGLILKSANNSRFLEWSQVKSIQFD